MKNLSKRSKIILAIAGVLVVVAIVVGVGMTQALPSELFGLTVSQINVSKTTILVGEVLPMDTGNVSCTWTTSDASVVAILTGTPAIPVTTTVGTSIKVQGKRVGKVDIVAGDGLNRIKVSLNVVAPTSTPTRTPTLAPTSTATRTPTPTGVYSPLNPSTLNLSLYANALAQWSVPTAQSCSWTAVNPGIVSIRFPYTNYTNVIELAATAQGSTEVRAHCYTELRMYVDYSGTVNVTN